MTDGKQLRQRTIEIPDTAPEPIKQLYALFGNNRPAVSKELGCNPTDLSAIVRGRRAFTPFWAARVETALQRLNGGGHAAPVANGHTEPAEPNPIEPWDGKTTTIKIIGRAGKSRSVKLPVPLAQLLERHGGKVADAGRALGYQNAGPLHTVVSGATKYTESMHTKIMASLHGRPVPRPGEENDDLDKHTLGLAICIVPSNNFERIEEVGNLLGAPLVFKRSMKAGWLMIFKMDRQKTAPFKRLIRRDATEVACP